MKGVKTRKFEKVLIMNGYQYLRTKGSHATYRNESGRIITIPVAGTEINACVVRRLIKEYSLACE